MAEPTDLPDLRALAVEAILRVDMHADLADLDDDEQAEYFDQADAVLAAVLPAHRALVLTEVEEAIDNTRTDVEIVGSGMRGVYFRPWTLSELLRRLAATGPADGPSEPQTAENAPAVGREAASPTADCGHDLEAFERQAAELTKLRIQVQAGACPHTESIGELHLKWLAEVADLKQRILDIDAHATPYGDIPDEPGWVGTYLVTAGALHRALGKVGHSAPKCEAEAERDRLEAERDEARAKRDQVVENAAAWMDEARHQAVERDRLADAIRRYEPVIEAAKVWLLPKGNTVEIDNAHNALEDAIEALGDASEAHPNPYRAASVMPHYPRIAAERTVVEAAKAWRAARPGPWTSGADVEFGLLCAVDALGDVGADPDGEQKSAHPPAGADFRTGPDTLSWADAAARVSADAQAIEASREDLAEREGQRYADLADETGDDRG